LYIYNYILYNYRYTPFTYDLIYLIKKINVLKQCGIIILVYDYKKCLLWKIQFLIQNLYFLLYAKKRYNWV